MVRKAEAALSCPTLTSQKSRALARGDGPVRATLQRQRQKQDKGAGGGSALPEARIRGHRKLPQTETAWSAWVPPHCEGRGAGASRETQEGAGGRKVGSPLPAHRSPLWSGSPRTPSLESSSPQRLDGAEAGRRRGRTAQRPEQT